MIKNGVISNFKHEFNDKDVPVIKYSDSIRKAMENPDTLIDTPTGGFFVYHNNIFYSITENTDVDFWVIDNGIGFVCLVGSPEVGLKLIKKL